MSSSNKDAITDYSEDATKRAASEQQALKNAGNAVVNAVKEGGNVDIKAELPSNEQIVHSLDKGKDVLSNLEKSERGQQLGVAAQAVIKDAKNVLEDNKQVLNALNSGGQAQKALTSGWSLIKEIAFDPSIEGLFSNWHQIIGNISTSDDLLDILKASGEFLSGIRDTQTFIELLADVVKVLRLFVAEKTEQVAEGSLAAGQEKAGERQATQEKAVEEIKRLVSELSTNETWKRIVFKGQLIKDKLTVAAEKIGSAASDTAEKVVENQQSELDSFIADVEDLLQQAAGETVDVKKLFEYSKQAISDIVNDDTLPVILYKIQGLLEQAAKDPAQLNKQETLVELRDLAAKLQEEIQNIKGNYNVKKAQKESTKLLEALKGKPETEKLAKDIKRLVRDVKSPNAGELLDPAVLTGLRQAIVPLLLDHLNNFPIPPIQDTADFLGTYDFRLDNIKISLPGLIPENIKVRFEYDLDAKPLDLAATNQRAYIFLYAKDIQIHIHDLSWWYERQSTPKISDSGLLSVDTGKRGLQIRLKLEVQTEGANMISQKNVIKVLEARSWAEDWKITFKDSKHDILYKTLTKTFSGTIRTEIKNIIERKLRDFGSQLNDQLVTLLYEAKKKNQELSELAKDKIAEAKDQATSYAQTKALELAGKAAGSALDAAASSHPSGGSAPIVSAPDLSKVGEVLSDAKNAAHGAAVQAGEKTASALQSAEDQLRAKAHDLSGAENKLPTPVTGEPVSVQYSHGVPLSESYSQGK